MDKLDEKSAEKFINALVKSVQVLCHGYLNFHNGIEIIGHINLSVDKESSLHYILEEKVCKSEENSTMFISNSFYAQKAELQAKEKGCENVLSPGSKSVHSLTGTINLNEMSNASLIISTCGSSSDSLRDKSHSASTSSASEAVSSPCKTASSPAKRKASSDCDSVKSKTKSSYVSPGSERFATQSPHKPASVSSLEDTKPSVKDLTRNEELSEDSLSLPNVRDIVNNLGVDLVSSVLEPVTSERTRSDCSDKHDDSDGDVEVTFIKKEFLDDSAYLPDNSCRFQYGRGTPQKASSSGKVADSAVYPDPHAHAAAASATYVSSASDLDVAGAQLHGLSTSASQPHQGISFSTEFCQAVHSSPSASATFVPSARGHDVPPAQLYGPSTSSQSHQGVSFSAGTGSQNGVSGQLSHSSHGGFMVGEASYTPPLAHHAHSSVTHPALGLSVLDLSIKAEPKDPDFVLFNCEPRRKKNSVLFRPRAGSRSEESREKAKEKSKEYRMKQKIHRMTDSTYDMIFRHRVAERKRRQRMRDRIKKLKVHGVADYSIAK